MLLVIKHKTTKISKINHFSDHDRPDEGNNLVVETLNVCNISITKLLAQASYSLTSKIYIESNRNLDTMH